MKAMNGLKLGVSAAGLLAALIGATQVEAASGALGSRTIASLRTDEKKIVRNIHYPGTLKENGSGNYVNDCVGILTDVDQSVVAVLIKDLIPKLKGSEGFHELRIGGEAPEMALVTDLTDNKPISWIVGETGKYLTTVAVETRDGRTLDEVVTESLEVASNQSVANGNGPMVPSVKRAIVGITLYRGCR